MWVLRVTLVLVDIAIVNGHGYRHVSQRVDGAHSAV